MRIATHGLVKPVLVLGLGNTLLRDDGFGPAMIERLHERFGCASDVELVDGGTIGLGLLTLLAGRDALVIVDAFRAGEEPGTVMVFDAFDPMKAGSLRGRSAHESNAASLLAVAAFTGDLPPRIAVIGVEPAEVATGVGLSPTVQAQFEEAVGQAVELIEEIVEARVCA
jgi:hydrogenase maturation protease